MAKANKRKQKQAAAVKAKAAAPEETRRRFLARAGWIGGGAAVVAGGGWFVVEDYHAVAAEHDLTRIGQGQAKVVQIHDPTCPICGRLQREARAAVEAVDDDRLCFLVANIRTPKGGRFAARHGVGHVTLLLFDGAGDVVEVMQGERGRRELEGRFRRLIG